MRQWFHAGAYNDPAHWALFFTDIGLRLPRHFRVIAYGNLRCIPLKTAIPGPGYLEVTDEVEMRQSSELTAER